MSHWWPMLQRSTQLRHLSALGPFARVTLNGADVHRLQILKLPWLFLSLRRPAHLQSDQTRKNASCGSQSVPSFTNTSLTDWVPAVFRTNRSSRVHEAFGGCFISFAQAFVSNRTSQRSTDKYCKLPTSPTVESALTHVPPHQLVGLSSIKRVQLFSDICVTLEALWVREGGSSSSTDPALVTPATVRL